MGLLQDIVKRVAGPTIEAEVGARMETLLKSADTPPKAMEVPAIMQIGQMFTGGARKKYNSMIDFDTLRTFSVVYDVARACINHRKRQMSNLEWSIVPKDDEADASSLKKPIAEITAFFEEPYHGNDFKMFQDKILEDLLVFDAAVMWKDKTYGGKLLGLMPVDGSTIRIKVGSDGMLPEPPEPAYQQILNGEVHGEYTTDEMYYKLINPRTNTPYGLGPLEGLVIGVDAALRSQVYNAQMLAEGTVPEGFFGMPPEWTPDQIKDYQIWFDTLLAGNSMYGSRIKFMPGGKGVGYMPTKKAEDMRYLEFEKWLLMKCCALFDVQPSDIGFIENMTVGNSDNQQELGNERGLVPTANFLKAIYTEVIRKDFGRPDLKFEWKGLQVVDDTFELERSKMMMEHGAYTINELRIAQGLEPLKDDVADKPMIYTTAGPILLEVVANEANASLVPKEVVPGTGAGTDPNAEAAPAQDPAKEDKAAAEGADLDKWETKTISYLKKGRGIPAFKSVHIPQAVQNLISARLSVAKSKEEVIAAFRPFKADALERSLINRSLSLRSDIGEYNRTRYESAGSRA